MARLLERLPSPSAKPSRHEQVAGVALFLAVTVAWTLWITLPDWDTDSPAGLTNPFDLGGIIAAVPSAVSVIVTGYLIGRAIAAVWLGWIPGVLLMAIGFIADGLSGLIFIGGLLLMFGWPVYFLPLIGSGVGLRSWHAKRLASPRPVNRRRLVVVAAAVAAVGLLGAAYYATTRDATNSEPLGEETSSTAALCNKSGLRYAGTTAEGAEVCFTLSPDRREWLEIGVSFVAASRCPRSSTGTRRTNGPLPFTAPGRLAMDGFAATVRGDEASGVFSDEDICGRKTFKWTARRVS